jgi:hypothetical protein
MKLPAMTRRLDGPGRRAKKPAAIRWTGHTRMELLRRIMEAQ